MGAQWHSEYPFPSDDTSVLQVNKAVYNAFASYLKKTCTAGATADQIPRIQSYASAIVGSAAGGARLSYVFP